MNRSENTDQTSQALPDRPLVLVVDDDDTNREVLRELLDDAGFATIGTRNGLEALNLLATLTAAPAFILLDLMMPVMDGWAFCDKRRQSGPLSQIPLIAISAADIPESERPAGIDAFLAKPIDLNAFSRFAARLAGRRSFEGRRTRRLH